MNKEIKGVSYAGNPESNTVMFITKKVEHLVNCLENVSNCQIYIDENIEIPTHLENKHFFVRTNTPQKDYAEFVSLLYEKEKENNQKRKYVLTEGGYTLGENVIIGNDSYIEPGCLIDHDVILGENAYIKSGTVIRKAIIGDNFMSCENCCVGTNGFTMTEDDNGNKVRIPTLGKVIIGDNVEINALTNISCGSAGNTIIGDYVKIDSLVHIGHDVTIERNVEIPAGAIIGGFDVLEEGSYVGINATLRNRIRIGKNAFVGMGSVVTKSVDDGVVVVGNPAKPFKK